MPSFTVKNSEMGERLDKVLSARFASFSRVYWQNQIKAGTVQVNNKSKEPRYVISLNDTITYTIPDKSYQLSAISYKLPLIDAIFENNDVIVINKPASLITHPAHANTEDSVVHRILAYDNHISEAVYDSNKPISLMRPGIVHRLDKDTSGVMIVAKNSDAMSFLAKQIQNHTAHKSYLALLFGHLEQNEIRVHTWLNRDMGDRRKMSVSAPEKGREAETIFHIKDLLTNTKGDKITLVEAIPITGRTHQIRVHATHIGHQVLGDRMYATHESELLSHRLGIKRQLLHAHKLSVRLPNHSTPSMFTAPIPNDIDTIVNSFSIERTK